jgi:branched-chain amino acid aminotransferase
MSNITYINGKFIPEEEARVSVLDRGFLYGDGLFETMRAYHGQAFRIDDHLERLYRSCRELKLPLKIKREELKGAIGDLLEKNDLTEAYLRLTLTRGLHTGSLSFDTCSSPTLVITARELYPYPPSYYRNGIRAIVASIRQNSFSPLSGHKSLSYLAYLLASEEARARDASEAILLNSKAEVTEGATSNIFLIFYGEVFTPPENAPLLPGITRKAVIEILPRLDLNCNISSILEKKLEEAEEVFITNSLMEVMPVTSIDGRKVGGGMPGPITHSIARAYRELVEEETSSGTK